MPHSRQVPFFSSGDDLGALFEAIEPQRKLKFSFLLTSETSTVQSLSFQEVLEHVHSDHLSRARYLVTDWQEKVNVERAPLRQGGWTYFLSPILTPRSVTFVPSVKIPDKDMILIGSVGTAIYDPHSLELLNVFAKAIKKTFKNLRSYYVGPEAEKLLDAGWRLSSGEKSPPEYDLQRCSPS